MKVLTAKFTNGRLDIPEGSLCEGETITLLVQEGEQSGFDLTAKEKALLLESLAQADRGEVVDGWQLLADLKA